MLFHLARSSPAVDPRGQIVIAPHHPDRLRRPAAPIGAIARARFQQSLAWNVFRTLELLPPAFWLRRLHIRLVGAALPEAPQIVQVHLWSPLPLPPAMRLDGARAEVVVDVLIETEHAVWTLPVHGVADGLGDEGGEPGDSVSRIIDAGIWRAGSRHYCLGMIDTEDGDVSSRGAIVLERLSRSRASVALRSGVRGASAAFGGAGVVGWQDLAAILRDCEQATALTPIERALARNAVAWLERVGVRPDAGAAVRGAR